MDGRRLTVAGFVLALALLALGALSTPTAGAATVIVMRHDGTVRRENNRFISAADSISPASASAASGSASGAGLLGAQALDAARVWPEATTGTPGSSGSSGSRGSTTAAKAAALVPAALAKLAASGQLPAAQHGVYLADWNGAVREARQLSRPRAEQLDAVMGMLEQITAEGDMTASRLPVLFLTLTENATYWRTGPMLAYGARVQFAGSELEWEYYTGEGIQLQVLGTFGEANGFYAAGRATWPNLVALMNQMIPLAVQRGGGLAWEYYFDWEGGTPPWVSAMAQGTALEALTNAYRATANVNYLITAHSALGILETPPPVGVAVTTSLGKQFLQYSFAPHTDIINAFLQTLIGLDDYASTAHDPTAATLFAQGNAQAQSVLGSFNTGAWSLYQPGVPDDLNYHVLVTGFLQTICGLTTTPIYCSTFQAFTTDLHTPPVITQVTTTAAAHKSLRLYFTLNKPAHVGVVVANAAGVDSLYTSANCAPGTDYWLVPKLAAGTYSVKLSGTDLAGNFTSTTNSLTVG